MILHQSAPFKGILVIFAASAFAVSGAKNSRLEALTVFFETATFFARAALNVMLHGLSFLNLQGLMLLLAYLGPESIGSALESLAYCLLSNVFVGQIVLARVAVTAAGHAIKTRGKAFAVQLETLRVSAIAPFKILVRRPQRRGLL